MHLHNICEATTTDEDDEEEEEDYNDNPDSNSKKDICGTKIQEIGWINKTCKYYCEIVKNVWITIT